MAELACFPKPGLVSYRDNGSHYDMDARLLEKSIRAIAPHFAALSAGGRHDAPFPLLRDIGVCAEYDMREATGGINTHRGAIFSLGLLVAGAARLLTRGMDLTPASLSETVARRWGEHIALHTPAKKSHGDIARERHGTAGARGEAADGFPTVVNVGLPVFEKTLCVTGDRKRSLVQALCAIMAVMDDTNIIFRGGLDALRFVQETAGHFLDEGGVGQKQWRRIALDIHLDFVGRGLSPGGAADLLACTVFVSNVTRMRRWA